MLGVIKIFLDPEKNFPARNWVCHVLFAKKMKFFCQMWPLQPLKHFTAAYRGFPPCTQSQYPINRETGYSNVLLSPRTHLISQDSTNHTTYYNALCSALECRVQCSAAATWRGESRWWLQWPTDARPCQTSPLTSVIVHLHLTNWILSFTTRL